MFAFIGTNAAASAMIKDHPSPNRLRICLGLDAKNPSFVLPSADLDLAVSETILGALSYNGQRCTAIKVRYNDIPPLLPSDSHCHTVGTDAPQLLLSSALRCCPSYAPLSCCPSSLSQMVFVHDSVASQFLPKLVSAVDALKMGLPWESGVKITPLPEPDKPAYLQKVIADAVSHGAKVLNPRGAQFDRTFVAPTVVFPINDKCELWWKEQFGPVIPVATFSHTAEIHQYLSQHHSTPTHTTHSRATSRGTHRPRTASPPTSLTFKGIAPCARPCCDGRFV